VLSVAEERHGVAPAKFVLFAVHLDDDGPIEHVEQFAGARGVRFAQVHLARHEGPIPQFDHIRRLGAGHEDTAPTTLACPQHCPVAVTRHPYRFRGWWLDQRGQPDTQCIAQPQQGPDARIHRTLLNAHDHSTTHPRDLGQPIQRPVPKLAFVLDPRTDSAGQSLRCRIHTMQNSALLVHNTYAVRMYAPPFNVVHDEAAVREMVAAYRTAWLVTADEQGLPAATLLPIMWRADTVIAHMAKANAHWRHIADDAPGLLIATGADAYISPVWYAAKAEHGKVVPTWNYSAVQLTGTVRVHHDADWLRAAVTELTDLHEAGRTHPWHVADAPEQYISGQLRGIVGIEFTVTRVDGKAKLSQNRSDADQQGVIRGLRDEQLPAHAASGARTVAATMADTLTTDRDETRRPQTAPPRQLHGRDAR